jgi:hypothetical protein
VNKIVVWKGEMMVVTMEIAGYWKAVEVVVRIGVMVEVEMVRWSVGVVVAVMEDKSVTLFGSAVVVVDGKWEGIVVLVVVVAVEGVVGVAVVMVVDMAVLVVVEGAAGHCCSTGEAT